MQGIGTRIGVLSLQVDKQPAVLCYEIVPRKIPRFDAFQSIEHIIFGNFP